MASILDLAEAVIAGDEVAAENLTSTLVEEGEPPRRVLEEGLLAGMSEVGRRFQAAEYYLPEVLVAAEALRAGMAVLAPHLARAGVRPAHTAVVATVRGDLHDIGKNLVATMLTGAGFAVVDLGVDVAAEQIVAACRQQRVDVVALSALLTTTMPMMGEIVRVLRAELDPAPRVLVGGAPVTAAYAKEIGADGYGADAASGAALAQRLCAAEA